jgi:hypothetical protein
MKIYVALLVLCAVVACVNAQQYVSSVAYTTSSCTGTNVGGSTVLQAATCAPVGAYYQASQCNSDNSVSIVNCTDSACTTGCVVVSNVPLCASVPGEQITIYLNTICYASYDANPLPTTNGFIQRTYGAASCAGPVVEAFWGPTGICIAGEPEADYASIVTCDANAVNITSYAGAQCSGTPILNSIAGCLAVTEEESMSATCVSGGPTISPTLAPTSSTSGTSTSTSGNSTHSASTSTSSTSTTSDAVALSVSAFVAVASVLALLF